MTKQNDQLSRAQLVGMLLMGLCAWAVIVGVIFAVVAPNGFPGLVIAVAGLIGINILIQWLKYINKPEE